MQLLRLISAVQFVLGIPFAILAFVMVNGISFHLVLGLLGDGAFVNGRLWHGGLLFLQLITGFVVWSGWGALVFRFKLSGTVVRWLAALSLVHHAVWMALFFHPGRHVGSQMLFLWLAANLIVALTTLAFYEDPEHLIAG